jgi:hypothetical protein
MNNRSAIALGGIIGSSLASINLLAKFKLQNRSVPGLGDKHLLLYSRYRGDELVGLRSAGVHPLGPLDKKLLADNILAEACTHAVEVLEEIAYSITDNPGSLTLGVHPGEGLASENKLYITDADNMDVAHAVGELGPNLLELVVGAAMMVDQDLFGVAPAQGSSTIVRFSGGGTTLEFVEPPNYWYRNGQDFNYS